MSIIELVLIFAGGLVTGYVGCLIYDAYVSRQDRVAPAMRYSDLRYRYIAKDDLPVYIASAQMDGFNLKVIQVKNGFAQLHLTVNQEGKLKDRGLTLLR